MTIYNDILSDCRKIAVVGCSRDEEKDAHKIPKFLQKKGYKIIPVNPYADHILGEEAYPSIDDIDEKIDMVLIFRPSNEAFQIVKESLKTSAEVIWMQKGIKNEKAKELAEKNCLKVVQNKCTKVEYKKYFAE